MAAEANLSETLSSFKQAAEAAVHGLSESDTILPPENGISLLDAKNEIFLSYLQALALRNLNVIRSLKDGGSLEDAKELSDNVTSKLLEQRIYLERGVRPLEQKIKYQVDRVLKATEDEQKALSQVKQQAKALNGRANRKTSGSEEGSEDEDDSDMDVNTTAHKPNASAFAGVRNTNLENDRESRIQADGVYRPPRISATSMPTTEQRERKERRPGRSATLDEYVNTELSNAPLTEPSIGSTITASGRKTKDTRQLAKEQERRDYEETHLMRLPKESRKERAKQTARDKRGGFGGEEWRGLGESVDRIGDLTKRKNKDSVLDRSRKRRAVEDSQRSDGTGDAFNIKKQRVMKKMRR